MTPEEIAELAKLRAALEASARVQKWLVLLNVGLFGAAVYQAYEQRRRNEEDVLVILEAKG